MRANQKSCLAATLASAIIASLIVTVMAAGCASTKVTGREQLVTGPLPRPAHIWVYDFTSMAADVPAHSALTSQIDEHPSPQSAQDIAEGRELGAQIAAELVQEIQAMGLPAMQYKTAAVPQDNDIVIQGHIISLAKGSAAKRIAIGFGAGASELSTAVEGFQVTPQGLRRIGLGDVDSGSGKSPGAATGAAVLIVKGNPLGLIVSSAMGVYGEKTGKSTVEGRAQMTAKEIGTVLEKRFQEQDWIKQ